MRSLPFAFAIGLMLGLLPLSPVLAAERNEAPLSAAALDQLLAPIALYPDGVLSQVLIAATYPLEIVQAERWSRRHPGLDGDAAVDAAADEGWHPSVTSLVAFPELLARLSEDLDWTQALGNAFLAQPLEIADRIQGLRRQADAAGSLQSLQTVDVRRQSSLIYIEPATPNIVYVPVYNTRIVYGTWGWPAYPPVYWSSPGLGYSPSAFYWGSGIHYRPQHYYSAFHWPQRTVVIVHRPQQQVHRPLWVRADHHRHQRWQHDQHHRRGVAYQDGRRPLGAWSGTTQTRHPPTVVYPHQDRRPEVRRPVREAPVPRDSGSRWSANTRPGAPPGVSDGGRVINRPPAATREAPAHPARPQPPQNPRGSAWRGGLFEQPSAARPTRANQPAATEQAPSTAEGSRWTRSENRAPVPAVRQVPPQRQLAAPVARPQEGKEHPQ